MNEPLTISVEDAAKRCSESPAGSPTRRLDGRDFRLIRLGRRLLVPRAQLLELVGASEMREAGFPASEPLADENVNGNAI